MARRPNTTGREPMLAEARREAIVEMLRASGSVTVTELQTQLGISPMTARRDLALLARRGVARRTHGGAVLPSISAHEDSFAKRLTAETEAKAALAVAAVELLSPDDAVFLDSSTSSYFVAQRIIDLGLDMTIVTNGLPVMHLVATQAAPNIELVAVGGLLRTLSQSFVGPAAVRSVQSHFTDRAFVSVRAISPNGILADVDPLEAEVKRAMIAQATEAVLLIDRSKVSARGLNAIGPINDIGLVLAHGLHDTDLKQLKKFDVEVQLLRDDDAARVRETGAAAFADELEGVSGPISGD